MKRPVGYAILAVLLGIMSLSGVFALFGFPQSMPPFRIVIPPTFYVLTILNVFVGAATAWSLWIYRRNAPEWFLGWALLGFIGSFYSSRVIMPQMMRSLSTMMPAGMAPPAMPTSMTLGNIAFDVVLGAAAYWYLATRRRPRMLASVHGTAPESPT